MDSNAPGQLLGFSLQFPRALYHLLRCGPGDSVLVEVVGDVATKSAGGLLIAEEDKSSTVGNPVTDMSSDLWKTFYNWIKAINAKTIDLDKTSFILYTNKSGRKALVDIFHKVCNDEQAASALDSTKNKLKKVNAEHELWPYYNFVINEHSEIFKRVLQRFEFQVVDGSIGLKEVQLEIEKKLIPKMHIEFLSENLCGWLQKELMARISEGKQATITFEAFQSKFGPLVERIHKRELIDFALQRLPQTSDLEKEKKRRPIYIQQLDAIGLNDDEILDEVASYLRATANRGKWIELEIIDETLAQDFEDRLYNYWQSRLKSLKITEKHLASNERGQLLLYDCKARVETIRDMAPPATTIAGTYHALADAATLGWHDEWEKSFK